MDLSREKIVFKATRRNRFWSGLKFVFLSLVIIWCEGIIMPNIVFEPQANYSSQQMFLVACIFLAVIAIWFIVSKADVMERFSMTENGLIYRNGISGKWSQINFDRIAAAALYTVNGVYSRGGRYHYRALMILGPNYQVLYTMTGYTDKSTDRAAELLTYNNIPVYQDEEEAMQATAGHVIKEPESEEPLNEPLYVYLHQGITWLPLLIIVCLFVGGVLNNHCGTQKDVVMYGRVIAWKAARNSNDGEIVLRSGQKESSFPVSPQLVFHVRIGDQVKVHYTRGCFGLDYGLTFKKL